MNLNSISCLVLIIYSVESYYVAVKHDGPIVLGGTITFRAQLYEDSGAKARGAYKFVWEDNKIPNHKKTSEGEFSNSVWNVTYEKDKNAPGEYEVQVQVSKLFPLFRWEIASARVLFNVTAFLNGRIDLIQNNTILGGSNINLKTEVIHQIKLDEADAKLVTNNQTIVTYWFLSCTYLGSSSDFTYSYNYTKDDVDKASTVRVLLVVGPSTNATIGKQTLNNTISEKKTFNNATNEVENVTAVSESTKPPDIEGCGDDPFIPTDPNKYYGHFKREVIPTSPVGNVNINGTIWLKNGELLHLNLTCSGSSPFYHCVRFIKGEHNMTGNETCANARQTQNCKIAVTRLLSAGSHYTILFIMGNKVSKTVTQVGVTMYNEQKHAQLSVIIVPISCSSIAIVLIVFGVAYYIQSKNRYTVEVADFDFSRSNDTEYKTFKERLRDAVSSAFTRVHEEYSEEGPIGSVWSPTRKNHPREGLLFDSDSETVDT